MKTYTVLLLRPDYIADEFGKDTYLAHVEAGFVAEAEMFARVDAVKGDYLGYTVEELEEMGVAPQDYAVLLVIEGRHMDIKTS